MSECPIGRASYAGYQAGCRCVDCRTVAREYKRRYRARRGGRPDADRATSRAMAAAVKLVRSETPDLWRELLADARRDLGLPVEEGPGGHFTKSISHGTTAGYKAHQYRKEPACDECLRAHARYQRGRRREAGS